MNFILENSQVSDSIFEKNYRRLQSNYAMELNKLKHTSNWIRLAYNGAFDNCFCLSEANVAKNILCTRLQDKLLSLSQKLFDLECWEKAIDTAEQAIKLFPVELKCMPKLLEIPSSEKILKHVQETRLPPNLNGVLAHRALSEGHKKIAASHLSAIPDGTVLADWLMLQLLFQLSQSNMKAEGRCLIRKTPIMQVKQIQVMSTQTALQYITSLLQIELFDRAKTLISHLNPLENCDQVGLVASYMMRLGEPEKALKIFNHELKKDTIWKETHFYKALTLKSLMRDQEALDALELDLEDNFDRPDRLLYKGQFLHEKGQSVFALEILLKAKSKAKDLDNGTIGILTNETAVVLRSLGRLDEALFEHKEALRLYPESWRVHFEAAITFQSAGRLQRAIHIAEKGSQKNTFANNLCPFLLQWLIHKNRILTPECAQECFWQGVHFLTPWITYRPWSLLLAMRSFYIYGLTDKLARSVSSLRILPGILEQAHKKTVCNMIEGGILFRDLEAASFYAKAAFPQLPCDSFEHKNLIRLALGET